MLEAVPGGTRIGGGVLRLIKADITELEVDAFVFYAQPDLVLGSGFGTAISVRGGPTIQKELEALGPLATGEALIASAGKLKAQHIIHAVGPRFQEDDTEGKLRTTVLNALKRVDEKGLKRVAFPAMGAGYYGIPSEVCARVMLDVFKTHLSGKTSIRELTVCVLDIQQYQAFEAALAALG